MEENEKSSAQKKPSDLVGQLSGFIRGASGIVHHKESEGVRSFV